MGLLPIDGAEPDSEENSLSEEQIKALNEELNEKHDRLEEQTEDFWNGIGQDNLYGALSPAFNSEPIPLAPVKLKSVPDRDGLFLLPGSINLAKYESDLAFAQTVRGSLGTQRNLPGAINKVLQLTGEAANADYLLVDLSPSLGAVNQNIVSISDKIIIPCAPDYFSAMALESLTRVFVEWSETANALAETAQIEKANYPFPKPHFKVLGVVISPFRVYQGKPASAFERWIRRVEDLCNQKLLPILKANNLAVDSEMSDEDNPDFVLAKIREFNSLRPRSQESCKPAYALSEKELGLGGKALSNAKDVRDEINQIYEDLAIKVMS